MSPFQYQGVGETRHTMGQIIQNRQESSYLTICTCFRSSATRSHLHWERACFRRTAAAFRYTRLVDEPNREVSSARDESREYPRSATAARILSSVLIGWSQRPIHPSSRIGLRTRGLYAKSFVMCMVLVLSVEVLLPYKLPTSILCDDQISIHVVSRQSRVHLCGY